MNLSPELYFNAGKKIIYLFEYVNIKTRTLHCFIAVNTDDVDKKNCSSGNVDQVNYYLNETKRTEYGIQQKMFTSLSRSSG